MTTKDLNLTAYLMAKGFQPQLIPNFQEYIFEFPDSEELDQLVKDFYERKPNIDAISFASKLRLIKQVIFALRKEE